MINPSPKRQIVINAQNYSFSNDYRLLIPFVEDGQWGMMDRSGEVVVKPQFDEIHGECLSESNLVLVCNKCIKSYERNDGTRNEYFKKHYGIINSKGEIILQPIYNSIFISSDNKLLTVQLDGKGYGVLNLIGEEVIPFGIYSYIDGFDHGLARVKSMYHPNIEHSGNQWGIIDECGEIVLPLEYSNIWNFYNKNRTDTCVELFGGGSFSFIFPGYEKTSVQHDEDYEERATYRDFAGSYAQDVMGYSDEAIYDAFEGDPDTYWNID